MSILWRTAPLRLKSDRPQPTPGRVNGHVAVFLLSPQVLGTVNTKFGGMYGKS